MILNFETLILQELIEMYDNVCLDVDNTENCIIELEAEFEALRTMLNEHKASYIALVETVKKLHSIISKQQRAN